jgi:hypothetical protein
METGSTVAESSRQRGRPRKEQPNPPSPQVRTIVKSLRDEVLGLRSEIENLTGEYADLTDKTGTINDTLDRLNITLLNLQQKQINPQQINPQQINPKQEIKTLSLPFEDYQTYYGIVQKINQYIYNQINNIDNIELNIFNNDFEILSKLDPSFFDRNKLNFDNIEIYKRNYYEMKSSEDTNIMEDFFNFVIFIQENNKIEFKLLPNIDPTVKRMKAFENKTLQGTNNIIFTKLKSEKKTSYDEILGDYTRIDIPKPITCKLRFNPKNGQNPFYVIQGEKKFEFNNIQNCKNFCLNGGFQADFINSKNNTDFNNKYKNKYVPSYVYR